MHIGCLTRCCWYPVITQQMQALLLLLLLGTDGGCSGMRSPLFQILKSGYLVLSILEAPVWISISCYTVDSCGPFESVESSLPLVLPTLWVFFSTRWTSIHGSSARDMDQEFLLLTDFLPLMVLFCAVTQTPFLPFSPQQLAGSVCRRSFSFSF